MLTGRGVVPIAPLALAGCEPSGDRGTDELGALPTLEYAEELRLGSVEDPDHGFARVTGVQVDEDGSVLVGEPMAGEIRVYDRGGTLLRRIGRRGEGPGEIGWLMQRGLVGDTVWVVDQQLQRITLFDRAGALLSTAGWSTVPAIQPSGRLAGFVGPWSMRADGLFETEMAVEAVRLGDDASSDSLRVPKLLFRASGTVVDTVGWDVWPPPDPTPSEPVRLRSRQFFVPRPDAALESIAGRSVAGADEAIRGEARRLVRDAMDFPTYQPPVFSAVAGGDGTLWLRREEDGGPAYRWLVLGPDGAPRGHVAIPRSWTVAWVSEVEFAVIQRDEVDVPWVVLFRMEG